MDGPEVFRRTDETTGEEREVIDAEWRIVTEATSPVGSGRWDASILLRNADEDSSIDCYVWTTGLAFASAGEAHNAACEALVIAMIKVLAPTDETQ